MMRMISSMLDAWLPDRCPVCGQAVKPVTRGVCDTCARLRRVSWPAIEGVDRCLAVTPYRDIIRDAIHGLKFEGQSWRGRRLGQWMADVARDHGLTSESARLIAIPQSAERSRQRGYNHAVRLAQGAANAELRVRTGLVHRTEDAGVQHMRTRAERQSIAGAFRATGLQGRIVLIDDVVTTGSTLASVAAAIRLEAGGPVEIDAWVLAWTPGDVVS
jgi:ComF family protein